MKQILAITRKELSSYFGSPMALIFVGVFLAATLFSFFWVDTFFARGLADVRPLFRWMPLLMIFLVAALTMRQWSEEEQSGTIEILLTLPVRAIDLVLGKFLAVMTLVAIALALTIFLPITVSILGNLDWGPVIGGYLATLLLAAAYAAIGLFLSSRTNNQLVALILTGVVGGIFYGIGTRGVTDLIGSPLDAVFRLLSTGNHFSSIERGVIDLRDLAYYLGLAGVFLSLNVLSLDSKRWSLGDHTAAYRRNALATTGLIAINLIVLNIWLAPVSGIRFDLTAQREFSLSDTTRDLVSNLQEPLLIRAYVSERTHPLLNPLIPRIADTLAEYQIAGQGMITTEVVDPTSDPELEAEANQSYGIRSTPFQVAGRYESALVNAYFDILVRYGDQTVALNFRDLIEVEQQRDGNIDVRLRNLEYDLTRSIKKVVFGFQSVDAVLASLDTPAKLTLFVTPSTLPEAFQETTQTIQAVASQIEAEAQGKFSLEIIDPDAPGAPLNRQALLDNYGLQPIALSLFSPESYYLHMLLQVGDQGQVIYPSGDMSEGELRTAIEAGLKRASPGFLKTVGIVRPAGTPVPDPATGQMRQPISSWQTVGQQLSQEYQIRDVVLNTGSVPADIDILLIIAPQNLTDVDRYAVDQYLMRGGSVIVAGGNYLMDADSFTGQLVVNPVAEGLQDMLAHYGVEIQDGLVLDPQNEPFPIPVTRDVGGFTVQDFQSINYPFFIDIRSDGMAANNPLVGGLPAITLNWASPLLIDDAKNSEREVTTLLHSTDQAWLRTDPNLQPDLETYPDLGFPIEGEQQSFPLAISIQGVFNSYFADKANPLTVNTDEGDAAAQPPLVTSPEQLPAAENANTLGTIDRSPDNARLVVIGSADFLNDAVFNMTFGTTMDSHLNKLQFIQNAVDWSVEDLDLLTIRARGAHVRLLLPLDQAEETFWEGLNYALALAALIALGVVWHLRRNAEQPMILDEAVLDMSQKRIEA